MGKIRLQLDVRRKQNEIRKREKNEGTALTVRTDKCVAFPCPCQRRRSRIINVDVFQPTFPLLGEFTLSDLDGKLVRPPPGVVVRFPPISPNQPLGNSTVPDIMEIESAAVPQHGDAVSAPGDVLVVQRLVDVPDKVDNEARGLVALPSRQLRVEEALRIVRQGRDDAAFGLAVPGEVDAAVRRGFVLGVDEVKGAREAAPAGVTDGVGPGGHFAEIIARLIAKEVLKERFGRVGDEVTC